MTNRIQHLYISVLNPLYKGIINKIDPKLKKAYLRIIFISLSVYFLLYYSESFYHILYTHTQRHFFASILMILATIFSMDRPLHTVKWRSWIVIPYLAGSLGLIITGFMHPIGSGYMIFGFMMLFVYLPFYLVWNNRGDYETLLDVVTETNLTIGVIYFLYCMALYPKLAENLEGTRFKGTILNANLFSMIGMGMVCSALYLIYRNRENKFKVILIALTLIPGFVIIVLGQSRSSVMIAAAAVISYIIFRIKNEKRLKWDAKKKIAIAVMSIMCVFLFVSIARTMAGESVSNDVDNSNLRGRFSVEGKDLNKFMSGRLNIWTNYSKHLNMTGNNFDEVDWDELTDNKVRHAHNNFLEYSYRCGVPVAAFFSILDAIACILAVVALLSRKTKKSRFLFIPIFTVMYAIDALLDISTIPFERYAPFFFYIVLCVLIDKNPNRNAESQKLAHAISNEQRKV